MRVDRFGPATEATMMTPIFALKNNFNYGGAKETKP
jgi:hypothetical protein